MGPGGIKLGNYNAASLSQDQRQWLWQQAGHGGQAPIGYGGESAWPTNGQGASNPTGSGTNPQDVVAAQKALNSEIVSENQPQISTLQGQQKTLAQQYGDLISTITGGEQPALNVATASGNAANAARGLTPNSEIALKNMTGIIAPVASQWTGLLSNAQQGSINDLNTLTQSIAALQAGNPTAALSGATNLTGLQEALAQAQLQSATSGSIAGAQYSYPFQAAAGQPIYSPATGKFSFAPNSGGGESDIDPLIKKIIAARTQQSLPSASSISNFVRS